MDVPLSINEPGPPNCNDPNLHQRIPIARNIRAAVPKALKDIFHIFFFFLMVYFVKKYNK